MRDIPDNSPIPPLAPILLRPYIPTRIQVSSQNPHCAQTRRDLRHSDARNEQGHQEVGVVLGEIGVSALSAIELVLFDGLGRFVGAGVGIGVGHFRFVPVLDGERHVVEAQEG